MNGIQRSHELLRTNAGSIVSSCYLTPKGQMKDYRIQWEPKEKRSTVSVAVRVKLDLDYHL